MGMTLTILGCDGSYPGPLGACSAYLVEAGASQVLLDLGCGSLPRLMAITPPEHLSAILLSHWHNDHASDLLALKYYLKIHNKSLPLYAPMEDNPLKTLVAGEEFCILDLETVQTIEGIVVKALKVEHPVKAYAIKLAFQGKSLVYTGDAVNSPHLAPFCQGADLLVCDATFTKAQWHPGLPHFSAAQAASLAREAQVGSLVITHAQPGSDTITLLHEAQAVFSNTRAAHNGLQLTL